MLLSKAKTVFNVSHLVGDFCFLSSDVDRIHVSYVICIILSNYQASKHATLQYKVLFHSLIAVRMIKTPKECTAYYVKHGFKVLTKLYMRKMCSYITASSTYKGGKNANKNSYSAISWQEICSVMSSDVSYIRGDFALSH